MLEKLRNSLLFSWAVFIGATVGLLACIFILIKAKTQTQVPFENRSNVFLADKRRTMTFYRVFSIVYDLLNTFFYTDTMRNEVADLASISPGSRVLDVGCGTGYTSTAVLKKLRHGEVVGIDLTPRQLRKALKNLRWSSKKAFLSRGDAENLPFRNEAFDIVVSVGAIEYFPNPAKAVKEMARVVKPRGRIIVGGPEYEWFKKFVLNRMLYAPSAEEMKKFLKLAGLTQVKSVLTGVRTYFGTDKYVALVVGTK